MFGFGSIIGSAIQGVTGVLSKREGRKTAKVNAEAKLAVAKQQGADRVELQRAEWEAIMARNSNDSWKDEFALICITAPFILMFVGAVYGTVSGDMRLLEGVHLALDKMEQLNLDYGQLMLIVIGASFGFKLIK